MTVDFKARIDNRTIDVSVTPDGDLVIPGLDIECELLREELGEKSVAIPVLETWENVHDVVLTDYFDIKPEYVFLVVIDYASKALPVHEKSFKYDTRPRKAIEVAKHWAHYRLDHPLDDNVFDRDLSYFTVEAANAVGASEYITSAHYAAIAVARITSCADDFGDLFTWKHKISFATRYAAHAIAMQLSGFEDSDDTNPEYIEAFLAADSWQKRRFHDCMEAIQSGKDWPDLKDTK